MELKKVQPGDPLRIPAETFNTFCDAARDYQNRRHNVAAPPGTAGDDGTVIIRNDSGQDLDRFSILGLAQNIVIAPADNEQAFKNRPALVGVIPYPVPHSGKFAVTAVPLRAGAIGPAYLVGTVPVRLDVVSADHWFAEVKEGDLTKLQTGYGGSAQILYKGQAGDGTWWGVVRFPFALDRYEVVAAGDGESFATLDQLNPEVTGQAVWDLMFTYDDGDVTERRVVVHSANVYGSTRRIQDLKFEGHSTYGPYTNWIGDLEGTLQVEIRAILTDFDPATITWKWAYTDGNLVLSTSKATHFVSDGHETHHPGFPMPAREHLPLGYVGGEPGQVLWNAEDAVYGWEVRLTLVGTPTAAWIQTLWQADLSTIWHPLVYVVRL